MKVTLIKAKEVEAGMRVLIDDKEYRVDETDIRHVDSEAAYYYVILRLGTTVLTFDRNEWVRVIV